MKVDKWVKRWEVPKSTGEGVWVVAVDKESNYGCSCPVWKFKRQECHHILAVKSNGEGKELKHLTDEERDELLLKAYAKKGYRYYRWYQVPSHFFRNDVQSLKRDKTIEDVKTFTTGNGRKVVIIKERPEAYEQVFSSFVDLLKRCNLSKKIAKNLFYDGDCGVFTTERYWVTQAELRQRLHKRWFDIVQYIIYNNTGTINPNLPEGSVYCAGNWGKRMKKLEGHYKFLR